MLRYSIVKVQTLSDYFHYIISNLIAIYQSLKFRVLIRADS